VAQEVGGGGGVSAQRCGQACSAAGSRW
jgi:hypothetical protein